MFKHITFITLDDPESVLLYDSLLNFNNF